MIISKILVPVDLNTQHITSELCLQASELALKYDAEINLLAVMPDYGMAIVESFFPEDAQKKLKNEFKAKLVELSEKYFTDNSISLTLRQGKTASQILKEANKCAPDLIMIGCRRKNLEITSAS